MRGDHVTVRSLWRRPARGAPVRPAARLRVSRSDGVSGDAGPGAGSPRQILIVSWEHLRAVALDEVGARGNVVLEGDAPVRPGALVQIGPVALRVTSQCAPCARGARSAGIPLDRFRELPRHLAAVVQGGVIARGDGVEVHPDRFESPPERFADRCAWAVSAIPPGTVVSTRELLATVGADRAYARALPRWLAAAAVAGAPVHRVIRGGIAGLGEPWPSWAPDAAALLDAEGPITTEYRLGEAVWFQGTDLLVAGRAAADPHRGGA